MVTNRKEILEWVDPVGAISRMHLFGNKSYYSLSQHHQNASNDLFICYTYVFRSLLCQMSIIRVR
jgi:hypothetical protein